MVTWLHDYMVTWLHGYMVTWLHGHMVMVTVRVLFLLPLGIYLSGLINSCGLHSFYCLQLGLGLGLGLASKFSTASIRLASAFLS